MTIDARNSVRINNSSVRTKSRPQGIVSGDAEVYGFGYDRRLFFFPKFGKLNEPGNIAWGSAELAENKLPETSENARFGRTDFEGRNCREGAKTKENLLNCLAFKVKFYYNKGLYCVVGPWLMQGVAKLRKVAEVNRTGFNYLKLPHIANSKGTIVVK